MMEIILRIGKGGQGGEAIEICKFLEKFSVLLILLTPFAQLRDRIGDNYIAADRRNRF